MNNADKIIERKQQLINNFYRIVEDIEAKTNSIELGDEVYSIICSATPDGYTVSIKKDDSALHFNVDLMFRSNTGSD